MVLGLQLSAPPSPYNAAKAEIYTKATEIYANDYRSFNNLGMVLYAQGKVDEAARCFAKALELAPNCPNVNYNNGLVSVFIVCRLSDGGILPSMR